MSCVEYLLVIMICLATRLPPFDGWSFGYFSQFPLSQCGQFDCMHFILGNRLKIFSLNTSFSFSLFVSSAYLHFCCCFFPQFLSLVSMLFLSTTQTGSDKILSIQISAHVYSFSFVRLLACRHGSTAYNNCGEKCKCHFGSLINCIRIRKEFTAMSLEERRRYISAIKRASTDQRFRRDYENLINMHQRLFFELIHEAQQFLPWHRWFILQYENLLRRVDCKVTVAFWDWSLDSNPWDASNEQELWHSGDSGFGGNGRRGCVQDGPFRQGVWSAVSPTGQKCLNREFRGIPPDAVAVREVILQNNFVNFERQLRVNLHDQVHCLIGGTMCSIESASAPEFFLHHGFIDKIWDDRQKRTRNYAWRQESLMGSGGVQATAVTNLSQQPGGVRVEYEASQRENRVMSRLKGKTLQITRLVRNQLLIISITQSPCLHLSIL